MENVLFNFKVDDEVKEQSEKILNDLGLTLSGAINIFLRQVIIVEGIPFEVRKKPSLVYEKQSQQ